MVEGITTVRVVRSEQERQNAHAVFAAYMDMRYSKNMSRDETREKVIPTYMGLIKQIDDQMGVLMQFLEERGLLDTTMIVFTSDHGDYLGDHWMGEKDLFHDQSAKIPLIVIDPSAASDHTRERYVISWSKRSIWRQPSSNISAVSLRIIYSRGVR
jgi:arylsulfatase A-like enzyme